MKIVDILVEELVLPALASRTKPEILAELSTAVTQRHPELDQAQVVAALEERERLNSTGLGDGVAIPHGRLPGLRRVFMAFGRSRQGVDFQSADHKPTHLFFLLVAPEDSGATHLKALARISRLVKDPAFRSKLLEAPDAHALWTALRDEDARY